jgi:hypothetical protein
MMLGIEIPKEIVNVVKVNFYNKLRDYLINDNDDNITDKVY